jgi:hypothetical protein
MTAQVIGGFTGLGIGLFLLMIMWRIRDGRWWWQ